MKDEESTEEKKILRFWMIIFYARDILPQMFDPDRDYEKKGVLELDLNSILGINISVRMINGEQDIPFYSNLMLDGEPIEIDFRGVPLTEEGRQKFNVFCLTSIHAKLGISENFN